MSYCLNPNCQKPGNPTNSNYCQNCGSKLYLKDRYLAIKPIGAGAMGRTYLASDTHRLNTPCLIKQFSPSLAIQNQPELMAKATHLFQEEAKQLSSLGKHPQIPTLYAFFEDNKQLYLIEELIEGQDLSQSISTPYTQEEIHLFLKDILPVLQFIHQNNVIHRDIKPANIIRRHSPQKNSTISDSNLVLIDFGICKEINPHNHQQTGSFVGTEGYAPIEQMRAGRAYPASDLYSLGVTCIQLLSSTSLDQLYDPLQACWNWQDYLSQKGEKINQKFSKILNKMLKDSLQERYQKADEILHDLNNLSILTAIYCHTRKPNPSPLKTPSLAWKCLQTLPHPHQAKTGHSREVNALAISPQSYILASGSWDHTIKLWNLKTGQLLRTLYGHHHHVSSLSITSNGYVLASGSWDSTIKLWHTGTGQLLHTLDSHTGYIHALAITPNNQTLLSTSRDKTLKIWDLNTATLLHTISDVGCIRTLDICSDATLLATGSDDRTLKLWHLNDSQLSLLHTFTTHSHSVRAVAFSPNRQLLASGSWDTTIQLWELGLTGQPQLLTTLAGHTCYVYSLAFSPDSALLASASKDGSIRLWDVKTGQCLQVLRSYHGSVYAAAFCGEQFPLLASAGEDGRVCIWGENRCY